MKNDDNNENNCQLPVPPEEAHYTIYKLTAPNGKVYIGCTGQRVKRRWINGKNYTRSSLIGKAIEEYGWDNFEKEILCENLIRDGADKLEKWFIDYYDSCNPEKGYNLFYGGLNKGIKMSEAMKQRNREQANRIYKECPEIKETISNSVKALYAKDPTYRARISEKIKAAYVQNSSIKRILAEKAKKRWKDPEMREKYRCGRIRFYENNQDYSVKQHQTLTNYYCDHPERREEISRQMQKYLAQPGNRAFVESDCKAKPVLCVETGERFPSQYAAERETGYSGIHKVCLGIQRTCGGYHWKYAEEREVV